MDGYIMMDGCATVRVSQWQLRSKFIFSKSVISCTKRTMQSNKGNLSGDDRPSLNQYARGTLTSATFSEFITPQDVLAFLCLFHSK